MNPLPDFDAWAGAADRLGLTKRGGAELVGPCLRCGGSDRLHIRRRPDGRALVGCRGCIDGQADGRRAFGELLRAAFPTGSESGRCSVRETNTADPDTNTNNEEARRVRTARALWARARLAEGSPGGAYLRARLAWPPAGKDFPGLPDDVRWVARERWPADLGPLPGEAAGAILFAFRRDPDGELRAVSVEALRIDGERLAHRWRRTVGAKRGAWFAPIRTGGAVCAVEGECDALAAVFLMPYREARAYGGSAGLAAAELPRGGRECWVLPDADAAGQRAAAELAKQYPAVRVRWQSGGDPAGDLAELVEEAAAGILERSGADPAGAIPAAWRSVLAWQAAENPCPTAGAGGAGIVQGESMPCTGRGPGRE